MVGNQNNPILSTSNQQPTTATNNRLTVFWGEWRIKPPFLPLYFFGSAKPYKDHNHMVVLMFALYSHMKTKKLDQTTGEPVEWSATDQNWSELDPCGVKNHRHESKRIESVVNSVGLEAVSTIGNA
jgi:hypothetical protein